MANVIDKFSGWTKELIKQELKKTSFPFSALFEQLQGDFNISCGLRNSNAFNAKKAFYYGKKKYDKRGCVGVFHYTDIQYLSSLEDLLKLKEDYVFVGIDCVSGSVSMETFEWPENTLMIFGEEGSGISQPMRELCDKIVHITQYGSVRSLNVGTASGIAMYDYVNKFFKNKKEGI